MNEGKTTAIFALVAAVSFGLAYWSAPRALMDEDALKTTVVGKAIFEKFDDPGAAQSLEIVKFNEEMATISRFEVAKDSDTKIWTLPSFDDYPADAEEQIRDATTPLIGLQVLSVESVESGSHSLYGVVNPDDRDLSVAESGVGMLLRVKDAENQILASLVVGKEVEGATNQRYVRVPSEDAVYVVELDSAPFTTEFGDWIDKKLLEVRSFDITSIQLRDYALFPTENSYAMRRNFDADFTYQPTASKWSLDRLLTYEGATSSETELPEGETVNEQALNDLRNAVQDLEIVDVRRKPDGLAADLKADKSLLDNQESLRSLYAQGFIPQPVGDSYEIFSTGGETIIGTDDGVQYNLRFGESDASLGASTDDDEENTEQGLRRYLLVTASLDESKFPTPDLEIVPQTVEEMQAMQAEESGAAESDAAGEASAAEPTTDLEMELPATDPASESPGEASNTTKSDDAKKDDAAGAEDEKAGETSKADENEKSTDPESDGSEAGESKEASGDAGDGSTDDPSEDPAGDDCGGFQEETTGDEAAGQAAQSEEAASESEQSTEAGETSAADQTEDSAESDRPKQTSTPEVSQEELEEELLALQEEITRANQRKLDEHKENVDQAMRKVRELNARFADWYYVVSDSVYKKLKISKDQLTKSASDAGAAPAMPGGPGFGSGVPQLPGFPPQQ